LQASSTSAISAFDSPAKYLSAISSRSRADSFASPALRIVRRSAASAASSCASPAATSSGSPISSAWRLRRRSSSSAALRAIPNSQARRLPRFGLEIEDT